MSEEPAPFASSVVAAARSDVDRLAAEGRWTREDSDGLDRLFERGGRPAPGERRDWRSARWRCGGSRDFWCRAGRGRTCAGHSPSWSARSVLSRRAGTGREHGGRFAPGPPDAARPGDPVDHRARRGEQPHLHRERLLREMGFVSEIYASTIGPGCAGRVHPVAELPFLEDHSQWILYQCSIGSATAMWSRAIRGANFSTTTTSRRRGSSSAGCRRSPRSPVSVAGSCRCSHRRLLGDGRFGLQRRRTDRHRLRQRDRRAGPHRGRDLRGGAGSGPRRAPRLGGRAAVRTGCSSARSLPTRPTTT